MYKYISTWKSLQEYTIPDWFRDAKFGIFIHWGVYSVPAFGNEWYPRNMYLQGTPEYEFHTETFGPHTEFGYKDFIPHFNAENFDPQAWVKLFQESGAKYTVPVAEHHDGFAMYDCSLSEWNAVKMEPKRDVIGELAEAVREAGMIFGFHPIELKTGGFSTAAENSPPMCKTRNLPATTALPLQGRRPTRRHGRASIGNPTRCCFFR